MLAYNESSEIEFWDNKANLMKIRIKNLKAAVLKKEIEEKTYWWQDTVHDFTHKKILDVGCGTNFYVIYWSLQGNNVIGIDLSSVSIKINKFLSRKLGLKITYKVGYAQTLDLKNDAVDVVHMQWILHHLPIKDIKLALLEANRVLKKNGILLLKESNFNYPFRWLVQLDTLRMINFLRKYAIYRGWLDPNERARSIEEYCELVRSSGFRIHKIRFTDVMFYYPTVLFIKSEKIRRIVKRVDSFLCKHIIPNRFSRDIMLVAKKD